MSEVGDYPTAAPLSGNERLLADQAGTTVNITPAQIAQYVGLPPAADSGYILIGTGTGFKLAPLTAGTNVSIVNAPGSVTIAAAGGGGGSATVQYATVTTNTTLSSTLNAVLVDATASNVTITLPTAVGTNFPCYVKRKDSSSNTLTIATTASQTIDGQATQGLQFQYTAVQLVSDNANWWLT